MGRVAARGKVKFPMGLITRTLFREVLVSALLGCLLFTSVLFLYGARTLFEFLVRNTVPAETVGYLFLLALPRALPYAIPLGVLVGTLLALSRMSSDGEITAMRAAGVSGRRVIPAVMGFGILATGLAAASSLWLTPWSIEQTYRIQNELIASGLTAEIQPRVFEERFPNTILYVREVIQGPTSRWRNIFLADLTPDPERGDIPSVTLATEAIAVPDVEQSRIQLSLESGSKYEAGDELGEYNAYSFAANDQTLDAEPPPSTPRSRPTQEMTTGRLYEAAYGAEAARDPQRHLEAQIELHQRLALPAACLVLALVGIPLGVSSRRSGKSPAVVLTVSMAFVYFISLITAISVARQESLPAEIAIWLPNIVFAVAGVILLGRMERPAAKDYWTSAAGGMQRLMAAPLKMLQRLRTALPAFRISRLPLLPGIIDASITASFLFYMTICLASLVLLMHVYTFFELLGDMITHQIPLSRFATYLFYLTPRLIYEFTPISVLVAVLVVFGILAKNNEVTAFKACGVSVYRLTAPVFITCFVLSGGLFAFNHYLVPGADRIQDGIRSEIKGRPAQTFLNPDQKWIYGQDDKIFYYRYFDQAANVMLNVNVYEIDSSSFRLERHISAERARWEPSLNAWVFQNGWSRELEGNQVSRYDDFAGSTRTFAEVTETPEYFVKEAIQSQMMNFQELDDYIKELQVSGFDTVALQVQFYKKFSVPLFTVILAMVSIPFAFRAGNKSAMAGVGISLSIFIAYRSIGQLAEQVGNLNQLPPAMAAWSPDVVFSLAGLYLLARIRT